MLKVSIPSQYFLKKYEAARRVEFDKVTSGKKPKVKGKAPVALDANAQTGLTWATRFVDHLQANLTSLLIGSPLELRKQIAAIDADPDFRQFAVYCASTARDKKATFPKLAALDAIVENLFDYDQLSRAMVSGAYALVDKHKQRICPYCQMHHVSYHMGRGRAKALKLRPPLDHFYPQSKYPYLATSLFNLVPSCEQCNSRVKLALDPLQSGLSHPFEPHTKLSFTSGWRTSVPLENISKAGHFAFSFEGVDRQSKEFAKFFKLKERYRWYDLELLDLVENYRKYQDISDRWKRCIPPIEYVLGFSKADAERRAIGLLLADAAERIVKCP